MNGEMDCDLPGLNMPGPTACQHCYLLGRDRMPSAKRISHSWRAREQRGLN